MLKAGNKGIVLFIVLMTVILVIILGNIILGLMFGQNRFTHHKVSRIQAYYAGLAGIRYADEMLRTNVSTWIPTPDISTATVAGRICRSATTCAGYPQTNDILDTTLPGSVNKVDITVWGMGSGINNTRKITATVNYTPDYTP
ncbi:MAG: hypothetical protein ABSE81_05290 [Candidatus Omnitrophota bacterium]|jgi:Tfp pilus assembly protein PilX